MHNLLRDLLFLTCFMQNLENSHIRHKLRWQFRQLDFFIDKIVHNLHIESLFATLMFVFVLHPCVYLLKKTNIRVNIGYLFGHEGHCFLSQNISDILIFMVDDFFNLCILIGFKDYGLKFKTRLQLSIQLHSQVDHVRDKDENQFSTHPQPLQHVVQKFLIVDELVYLIQDNNFCKLMISDSHSQSIIYCLRRILLFNTVQLAQNTSVDLSGTPHAHAIEVRYTYSPRVALEKIHNFGDKRCFSTSCVPMEAEWRGCSIFRHSYKIKYSIGLICSSGHFAYNFFKSALELVGLKSNSQFSLLFRSSFLFLFFIFCDFVFDFFLSIHLIRGGDNLFHLCFQLSIEGDIDVEICFYFKCQFPILCAFYIIWLFLGLYYKQTCFWLKLYNHKLVLNKNCFRCDHYFLNHSRASQSSHGANHLIFFIAQLAKYPNKMKIKN